MMLVHNYLGVSFSLEVCLGTAESAVQVHFISCHCVNSLGTQKLKCQYSWSTRGILLFNQLSDLKDTKYISNVK